MPLTKNTRIIYHYEKQNRKCYYCETDLWLGEDVVESNIDHKMPSSRGGKDTIENTCLSCQPCNTAKANMTEEEFRPVMVLLKENKITKKDLPDYAKYLVLKSKFEK